YPFLDTNSALNLTILVHELGHAVDYVNGPYKQILPLKLDKDSFDALLQPALKNVSDPKTIQKLENQYFQKCNKILESWIKETIADLLAIRTIGPAYLFSFIEFFARLGLENVPDVEHPAPAKRLELMFDELQDMRYFAVSTEIAGLLRDLEVRVRTEA